MKAKTVFSQIIQPRLVQYMIDKYGESYGTVETVKNTWRRTYPVSDEIVEEIYLQIKTIERTELGPSSRLESFQTLLNETIADHLLKYVKRLEKCQNLTKEEIKAIIKSNIDISENKNRRAQFVIRQVQSDFIYICDISKTEMNITCQVQDVLWHLYRYHKLEDRRLFYRDTDGNIREIQHEKGVFKSFADGHFKDLRRRPRVGEKRNR